MARTLRGEVRPVQAAAFRRWPSASSARNLLAALPAPLREGGRMAEGNRRPVEQRRPRLSYADVPEMGSASSP